MHIKFLFYCLLSSGLLSIIACQQTQSSTQPQAQAASQDQALVTKIEAEIQYWQDRLKMYQTISTNAGEFYKEVEAATKGKADPLTDSLKVHSDIVARQAKGGIALSKENITDLIDRLAEYKAGTATKEALQLQIKVIEGSLGSMIPISEEDKEKMILPVRAGLGSMDQEFGRLQNELAQQKQEFSNRHRKPAAR